MPHLNRSIRSVEGIVPVGLLACQLLCVLLLVSSLAWGQAVVPSKGDGSAAAPYEFSEVGHLRWLQEQVAKGTLHDAYFIQVQDIDCQGQPLQPIGASSHEFTGHYDGQAYQVLNLTITQEHTQYVGFFGIIGEKATVQNLHLTVHSITGGESVGGLGGLLKGGALLNCSVRAASAAAPGITGDRNVGGAIGRLVNGRLNDIYTQVPVRLTDYAHPSDVGGLVGHGEQSDDALVSCYTLSYVYAPEAAEGVGGFIGRQVASKPLSRFWDSYAAGAVLNSTTGAVRPTGAFFGVVEGSNVQIRNCYYQSAHHGKTVSDGYVDGSYCVYPVDSATFVSGLQSGELKLGAAYSLAQGNYPYHTTMWGQVRYNIQGTGQAQLLTQDGQVVPDGSFWFIGTVLNLRVTPPADGTLEEIRFGRTYLAPYFLPKSCRVTMGDNTLYAKFSLASAVEGEAGKSIEVFPNPTCGIVRIETRYRWRHFTLHSPAGQLMRQGDSSLEGALVLDLSGLPPGLYALILWDKEAGCCTAKILLEP